MRIITGLAVLTMLVAGCAVREVVLAPPPNLYLERQNYPVDRVPEVLRNVDPRMFYVTDRAVAEDSNGVLVYNTERSNSMALGAVRVRFGAEDWADLVARTSTDGGRRISQLNVEAPSELVRFVDVPLPTQRTDGGLVFDPDALSQYDTGAAAFKEALRDEIRRTGNGRILIFTHGVRNDFDRAIATLANLWHYEGRDSIPIAFTWPAGNRGLLSYFRDREAGDFSVYHAKEFLRLLAEIPEVEDIDIVAHSRGTDVMSTALRELVIYHRGRGAHPKTAMKTGTLILAAADLDTGVVEQRLQAERVSEAFEQINIYVNPSDGALRLSSILSNAPRLGSATSDALMIDQIERLKKSELVHFIRVESVQGRGHSYFRDNPAVLSDIVLALRTRAFPGGTLRPLDLGEDGFWQLHPNYPLDRLPDFLVEGSDR
ncbi:alpha/beta hydrolase [uncultured Roseobacter sp.]|uniref:alpha/beta hydrolase n=1 Tax=uncultured Roseobacter sp. TaxID=114847 RepID=UPI002619F07F|nr:alpha/beta hydrolase [uncultured Roseobacter sp.]